jgi:hypothetical protein
MNNGVKMKYKKIYFGDMIDATKSNRPDDRSLKGKAFREWYYKDIEKYKGARRRETIIRINS